MPELFDQFDPDNIMWVEPPPPEEETDNEEVSAFESHTFRWLGYLAAGALIFAGSAVVSKAISNRLRQANRPFIAGLPPSERKPCPGMPDSQIAQIVRIVHQPENPIIAKAAKNYSLKPGSVELASTPGFIKAAHEAAAANGLHLAKLDYFRSKISNTPPLTEQLKLVNGYSKQFGFDVRVDFKDAGGNVRPFDRDKIRPAEFSLAFLNLMADFEYIPVEMVKATGLKQLRIVRDFVNADRHEADIAAKAYGANHIDIKLSDLISGSRKDIPHEMGHLFDYNFCGDYGFNYYDPQYDALNPGDFEYGTGGYWHDSTISSYGASNAKEDKAEMFANIFSGIDPAAVHSQYSVVRQKYDLLLARLEEKVPGSVEYLQQISH
jgi:hypothetical protein